MLTPHKSTTSDNHADRNPDGTFTKGSGLAKELGAQGGHASHGSGVSSSHTTHSPCY
jgi:hypothetical protein